MSIDLHNPSGENVTRLIRLLSRRPEYGIAIPSRRWMNRQEEKIKNLPDELLNNTGLLKRLFMKIADKIDPDILDPRAVLCKTHAALNPWLIRQLFLAVAYEITVHTDMVRSWKEKKNHPPIAAFVGRLDSIAALWTEPDLYVECYGTPPFESHMIFVQSGCEACILGAMGANARVLADLRTTLLDRAERRPLRSSGRRAKDPKLKRYVDEWIIQLTEERASQCIAMSDGTLEELRKVRPQLDEWRRQRKRENRRHKKVYTELKKVKGGNELRYVAENDRYRRRTNNGIPVAEADIKGAEDQRRAAMYSLQNDVKSVYRPDSISPYSQVGGRLQPFGRAASRESLQPIQEGQILLDDPDDYDDIDVLENIGDHPDLDRDFEAEERGRRKVTEWYDSRLRGGNLTAADTATILSMAHPAFRPPQDFSHISAAPSPLNIRRDYRSRSAPPQATDSVWTDITVYTTNGQTHNGSAPAVPQVPEQYRRNSTNTHHRNDNDRDRTQARDATTARRNRSSSIYSNHSDRSQADDRMGRMRRFLAGDTEMRSRYGGRDTQGYAAVLPSRSQFSASVPALAESRREDRREDRHGSSHRESQRPESHHQRSRSQESHHHHRHHHHQSGSGRSGSGDRERRPSHSHSQSHNQSHGGDNRGHHHHQSHNDSHSRRRSSTTVPRSHRSRPMSPEEAEREDRVWKQSLGIRPDEDDGLSPDDSHSVAFWREPRR
ncbi:hypothetical protein F5Y11DRAFT_4138 [Daldinia sp. FL1419]|nr:hypothetical protein F5Y11DRAFT_4138 [Daldinia sp. FL1419]